MAKARLNPVLLELHGKMGDMVFRRTQNGGISLIRKADMSDVKWSPAQSANRKRFSQAVAYARTAMADAELKASYEKAAAISDYLKNQKK